MKKIGLLITLILMTMSSANAGYWSHTPTYGGGFKSEYHKSTSYDYLKRIINIWIK